MTKSEILGDIWLTEDFLSLAVSTMWSHLIIYTLNGGVDLFSIRLNSPTFCNTLNEIYFGNMFLYPLLYPMSFINTHTYN